MNWILILLVALGIEAVTIFIRFFFKISTREVLIKIMKRLGWRRIFQFHHMFTGIIVVAVAYFYGSILGVELGLGILISDIIHHFIVLWIIVGSPEFHIVYKNVNELEHEQKKEQRVIKRVFEHLIHEVC